MGPTFLAPLNEEEVFSVCEYIYVTVHQRRFSLNNFKLSAEPLNQVDPWYFFRVCCSNHTKAEQVWGTGFYRVKSSLQKSGRTLGNQHKHLLSSYKQVKMCFSILVRNMVAWDDQTRPHVGSCRVLSKTDGWINIYFSKLRRLVFHCL